MKIDEYKTYATIKIGPNYNSPSVKVDDCNILKPCLSTNHQFLSGTIVLYGEIAATIAIVKSRHLIDCNINPSPLFIGLTYRANSNSEIRDIKFPYKISSIEKFVCKLRGGSSNEIWRMRIKMKNPVAKFQKQQALDARRAASTLSTQSHG